MMASVDIAIPNYNYGCYLRQCLESVLDQGIDDLRVLIIDNASTDSSAKIARELAAQDPRVECVIHDENLGPHASFNEAVDWASGDYFMILCSDDLLVRGSVASMVAVMERHKDVSFAYGSDIHWKYGSIPQCQPVSGDMGIWRIRDGEEFIYGCCRYPARYIAAGMVLVRTSAQKEAGYFRSELPHTDDFEILLRLACTGRVADAKVPVGIKRMHGNNRTNNYTADRSRDLQERFAALESFFNNEGRELDIGERLRALGRRSIAERAYWCGVKDLFRARPSAKELLKFALKLNPRLAVFPPFGYLSRTERGFVNSVRDLYAGDIRNSV